VQQRAFSRTGRTNNRHNLAAVDLNVHPFQDLNGSISLVNILAGYHVSTYLSPNILNNGAVAKHHFLMISRAAGCEKTILKILLPSHATKDLVNSLIQLHLRKIGEYLTAPDWPDL
jgi:hypothetical protein